MRRTLATACMIVLSITPAAAEADSRWLTRVLPGASAAVTYFFATEVPAIALTIDDGVDPETTPDILDALRAQGATATFFLLGDSVAGNEALVRRIVAEGHEIGHHMARDEISVLLPDEELERKFTAAADALEAFAPVRWFRPGSGIYDARMLALSRKHGYRVALASVAPVDTLLADAERMAGFIGRSIEPGSIVVLHDVGARGRRTVETLRLLLPRLQERGFRVVGLSELDAVAASEKGE